MTNNIDAVFAAQVRAHRKALGISQQRLGAHIGVNRLTIHKIENGTRVARLGEAVLLAGVLRVPLEDMVTPAVTPRQFSDRTCPTGAPVIRDEWVAHVGGADEHGRPFWLCTQCIGWHTDPEPEAVL